MTCKSFFNVKARATGNSKSMADFLWHIIIAIICLIILAGALIYGKLLEQEEEGNFMKFPRLKTYPNMTRFNSELRYLSKSTISVMRSTIPKKSSKSNSQVLLF